MNERWTCPACGHAAPAAEGRPECGPCGATLLVGKYALFEEVERGPYGIVFRAREPGSDRSVLLRLVPENFAVSPAAFVSAARLASTLVHPHIAGVYDAGEYRGRPYVVLQDVGGAPVMEAPLALREAVAVVRDAALALEHAHGRRFVHAELRPSCLRVSGDDSSRRVFVTGLGLGRSPEGNRSETRADAWAWSPEEREGKRPDARSNVYSLGAILYALVAGAPPSAGPKPLSGSGSLVDVGLESVILKAMANEADARYASAGFLAEALTRWLDGEASTLKLRPAPETQKRSTAPTRSREGFPRKARAPLAAAIGASFLVVLVVILRPGDSKPAPPREGSAPEAKPEAVAVKADPSGTEAEPAVAEPRPEAANPPPPPEPPEVAFWVSSVPEGARVLVNGRPVGPAPAAVYRRDLKDSEVTIRAELDGYASWEQKHEARGPSRRLEARLTPLSAKILVRGAPPRTMLHLFAVPDAVRHPRAVLALWSLEDPEVRRALEALNAEDAGHVREQLRALSGRFERAAELARVVAAPQSVRLESTAEADAAGAATFEGVRAGPDYRVFGTAAGRRDFCSDVLRPDPGKDLPVRAELPALPPSPAPVAAVPPPKPEPPPPAATGPENVGTIETPSSAVGVMVRLDPGVSLKAGDVLEAVRDGKVTAELVVTFTAKPDVLYAHGSAACRAVSGKPSSGNPVRRKK